MFCCAISEMQKVFYFYRLVIFFHILQHRIKFNSWWTVWFDILFTFSQLLTLHPCCRIRATKCVQRTIALYQYKLFNLFPFSVSSLVKQLRSNPGHNMRDRNQGFFFFFSRHAQPPLGLWLRTLQCEWINILLRTLSIWFLLNHNALRFSLHLAESVLKEIQKTNAVWLFFFYLLLVTRLRFSLEYLCV